jgi:hypothetical protein
VKSEQRFQPLASRCIVCNHDQVTIFDHGLVLGEFSAVLASCDSCGQEWFDAPEAWLAEAYASPIANTDTGIVSRSLRIHRAISSFLSISNIPGKVLDWGSGSGLLTRLLRDDGHECYGFEPYTSPVLAGGFTWKKEQDAYSHGPYRAIIAIEVVEHLANPQKFFATALSATDTLIFSTELVDKARNGRDWWYYSRETGQHIAFYTQKSLAHLASLNSCKYASSRNKSLHIITNKPSDLRLFSWLAGSRRALLSYPFAQIFGNVNGRRSLMMSDHLAAKQILHAAQARRSE